MTAPPPHGLSAMLWPLFSRSSIAISQLWRLCSSPATPGHLEEGWRHPRAAAHLSGGEQVQDLRPFRTSVHSKPRQTRVEAMIILSQVDAGEYLPFFYTHKALQTVPGNTESCDAHSGWSPSSCPILFQMTGFKILGSSYHHAPSVFLPLG